jgi:mannose-6-phosphate isomerase-like protein (cupin superfamily)
MIRQRGGMETEIRERMREGSGSVEILQILRREEIPGGKVRLFARLRLPPGSSIGPHGHQKESEIFYVLNGQGTLTEDGTASSIAAGDASVTGGGASHSLSNTGTVPLEVLAVIVLD